MSRDKYMIQRRLGTYCPVERICGVRSNHLVESGEKERRHSDRAYGSTLIDVAKVFVDKVNARIRTTSD